MRFRSFLSLILLPFDRDRWLIRFSSSSSSLSSHAPRSHRLLLDRRGVAAHARDQGIHAPGAPARGKRREREKERKKERENESWCFFFSKRKKLLCGPRRPQRSLFPPPRFPSLREPPRKRHGRRRYEIEDSFSPQPLTSLFLLPPSDFKKKKKIDVDQTRHDLLRLNFNVSFPYTPCAVLHVDTADQSGEGSSDSAADVGSDGGGSNSSPSPRDLLRAQHSLRDGARRTAVPHLGGGAASAAGGELHKFRLDANGADLPGHPEFVPPSAVHVSLGGFSFDQPPAVDAAALDAAFDAREGCRLEGWLAAQRVAGTLLFRPHLEDYLATRAARSQLAGQMAEQLRKAGAEGKGRAFLPHVLRIDPDFSKLNVMHVIHELSFESGREGGDGGGSGGGFGGGNHYHHHGHHHHRRPHRSARSRAVAAARSGALGKDVQEALPRDPLSGVLRGSPRRTGTWK